MTRYLMFPVLVVLLLLSFSYSSAQLAENLKKEILV
jgi:hypothetical protein